MTPPATAMRPLNFGPATACDRYCYRLCDRYATDCDRSTYLPPYNPPCGRSRFARAFCPASDHGCAALRSRSKPSRWTSHDPRSSRTLPKPSPCAPCCDVPQRACRPRHRAHQPAFSHCPCRHVRARTALGTCFVLAIEPEKFHCGLAAPADRRSYTRAFPDQASTVEVKKDPRVEYRTRARGANPPAAAPSAHTVPTRIRQSTETHISLAIVTFDPMMENHGNKTTGECSKGRGGVDLEVSPGRSRGQSFDVAARAGLSPSLSTSNHPGPDFCFPVRNSLRLPTPERPAPWLCSV